MWLQKKKWRKVLAADVQQQLLRESFPESRPIQKIFAQRQCDSGQIVLEYSRSHSLFNSSSEEGSKKRGEIGRKTDLASSGGAADVLRHYLDQVQHVIAASDEEQRSDSQQEECQVKSFPFSQNKP